MSRDEGGGVEHDVCMQRQAAWCLDGLRASRQLGEGKGRSGQLLRTTQQAVLWLTGGEAWEGSDWAGTEVLLGHREPQDTDLCVFLTVEQQAACKMSRQ